MNEKLHTKGGNRLRGIRKQSMKRQPLITVVTVTYNASQHLERAILSVLNQSYRNIEYIIIDGNSTDETVDILQRFDDRLDFWLSEPDDGIYDAMNKAVALGNGSWFYFLGADDILVNCLHRFVKYLNNEHIINYGNVYLPQRNKLYAGRFDTIKLSVQNICQQAILYPALVFEKYIFSTRYPGGGDYDLNLKCWGDSAFQFRYIPDLVAIFNDEWTRHPDAVFTADKPQIIEQTIGRKLKRAQLYRLIKTRIYSLVINAYGLLEKISDST